MCIRDSYKVKILTKPRTPSGKFSIFPFIFSLYTLVMTRFETLHYIIVTFVLIRSNYPPLNHYRQSLLTVLELSIQKQGVLQFVRQLGSQNSEKSRVGMIPTLFCRGFNLSDKNGKCCSTINFISITMKT